MWPARGTSSELALELTPLVGTSTQVTSGGYEWHSTEHDEAGNARELHDRLAETGRAIALLMSYDDTPSGAAQPSTTGTAGAFAAGVTDNRPPRTCHLCKKEGHMASRCPTAKTCMRCAGDHKADKCTADKNDLTCTKCQRKGHVAAVCQSSRNKNTVAKSYSPPSRARAVRSLVDSGSRDVVTPASGLVAGQGPASVTLTGIAGPVHPASSGVLAASVRGYRDGVLVEHVLPPVPAHVFPSASASLIGPGRFVVDHSYDMHWTAGDGAALYSPDGTVIPLTVDKSTYTISLDLRPTAGELQTPQAQVRAPHPTMLGSRWS